MIGSRCEKGTGLRRFKHCKRMSLANIESCREAEIVLVSFLDLTDLFQQRGQVEPLHLAPLDFHPNPRGNRVMAEAIYNFGSSRGFW
jgi:hypothetical protein